MAIQEAPGVDLIRLVRVAVASLTTLNPLNTETRLLQAYYGWALHVFEAQNKQPTSVKQP